MLTLDHPRDGDIHTLSDFAELLCLLTPDRFCSRDYITDYIKDYTDRKVSESDLDDVFSQFSWRANAFENFYPFSLDSHGRVLKAKDSLSSEQNAYAFILLCANLPFVSQNERQGLTDAFERASRCALRRLWPAGSEIKPFGKNETDYIGAKWERMNVLGINIGGRPQYSATSFRDRDTGDGGIDLVAWYDLDPHEKWNIPSALAQCACSRDEWPKKQGEISGTRLGLHLNPTHPWMEIIFIPQSFRNNQGRWAVEGDVGRVIVMDRLRLIRHLDPSTDWGEINPPVTFSNFLDERLSLV